MKLVGKTLNISKSEWQSIGKENGWTKEAMAISPQVKNAWLQVIASSPLDRNSLKQALKSFIYLVANVNIGTIADSVNALAVTELPEDQAGGASEMTMQHEDNRAGLSQSIGV